LLVSKEHASRAFASAEDLAKRPRSTHPPCPERSKKVFPSVIQETETCPERSKVNERQSGNRENFRKN
jgi:hypothetical protein